MRDYHELPERPTGIWRITTENGTVLFFDFDRRKWRRDPAARADGRKNLLGYEGRWNRLGWGPYLAVYEGTRPVLTDPWGEPGVRIGLAIHYGLGLDPNDQFFSTIVVSIERHGESLPDRSESTR